MPENHSTRSIITRLRFWLETHLLASDLRRGAEHGAPQIKPRKIRFTLICLIVFSLALAVRVLHLQDSHVAIEREEGLLSSLINPYRAEVARMIDDGGWLFPGKEVDPRDARMIVHPPGYSILIAAIYGGQASGGSYQSLRFLQIICDSAAAVMISLIAAELFPVALAALAGMLVALSPHLAHYSLWLSPDTLAVLPLLAGVLLIIKASKRPRLVYI